MPPGGQGPAFGQAPHPGAAPGLPPAGPPPGAVAQPAPFGGPGAGAPPAPRADRPSNGVAAVLGIVGGIAMVVGGFLPYVKTHAGAVTHSLSGWSVTGDAQAAVIIGGLAIVVAAVLLVGMANVITRLLLLAAGVAGIALASYDLYDILQKLPKNAEVVDAGIDKIDAGLGVYVVIGGGVLLVLAALLTKTGPRTPKPAIAGQPGVPVGPPPGQPPAGPPPGVPAGPPPGVPAGPPPGVPAGPPPGVPAGPPPGVPAGPPPAGPPPGPPPSAPPPGAPPSDGPPPAPRP